MSRTSLSRNDYAALCQSVHVRDEWRCRNCGFRATLCAHHIVFRSSVGNDTMENLVTLCADCHNAIHNHRLSIVGSDANYILAFVSGYIAQ